MLCPNSPAFYPRRLLLHSPLYIRSLPVPDQCLKAIRDINNNVIIIILAALVCLAIWVTLVNTIVRCVVWSVSGRWSRLESTSEDSSAEGSKKNRKAMTEMLNQANSPQHDLVCCGWVLTVQDIVAEGAEMSRKATAETLNQANSPRPGAVQF